MTPSKKDIQVRLLFLADDLDRTAKMLRAYLAQSGDSGGRILDPAGELSGAACLCREWVEAIDTDAGEAEICHG